MTVEYMDDKKTALFGDYKFTRDDRTGYYLSTTRIGKSRKRLHSYVWEYYNGDIPQGYQIHHKDGDKGNNDILNLDCLSEHDHLSHHSKIKANTEEGKEQFAKVQMAAKMWHSSDEGRMWHKSHYEQIKEKLHVPKTFICEYCGKTFESTKAGSKYCCNNHRAYARRESGVDNIEAACVICGKPFTKNKYDKTQTCSVECRTELKRSRKRL